MRASGRRPGRLLALCVALLLAIVWGSTWPAVRYGLDFIPPFTFAAARFVISGLAMMAIVLLFRLRPIRGRNEWRTILVLAVAMIAVPYAVQFWAQQYIPSGLGAVLNASIPFFVLLFGLRLLPQERVGGLDVAGLLVGFGGLAYVFRDSLRPNQPMALWGILGILTCSAIWGYATIIVRRDAREMHPVTMNAAQMLIGVAFLIVVAATIEGRSWLHPVLGLPSKLVPGAIYVTPGSVAVVLYLALFGSGLTFVLYFWVIKRMTALEVSLIALVSPLAANAFAVWWLDERLTVGFVIGSLITISGVALVALSKRE